MLAKIKATVPLALAIAVLAGLWVDLSLNFTFHWVTEGNLGNGLAMPKNFHLIAPVAFVPWGFFFAAGATTAAFRKVVIASIIGSVAAFLVMWISPQIADLPDFWGIALVVLILAFAAVLLTATGDWYYVPAVFGAFAVVLMWWIATGLDKWAPGGGGGTGLASLAHPATAGAGAFSGVISTPITGVWASALASLLAGCLLGLSSARLAGALTPKPRRTATPKSSAAATSA